MHPCVLLAHLPTYLPTYLPACLPTYLPTHRPTYLPTYLPTYTHTKMHTYMRTLHICTRLHVESLRQPLDAHGQPGFFIILAWTSYLVAEPSP